MSIRRSELLTAVALDLTLGDPRWLPHPIRAVGWIVKQAEEFWRAAPLSSRAAGVAMWLCVAGSATITVRATLPWLNVYWAWVLLALRGLDKEAINVVRLLLESGDIANARRKLAMIVGRDTAGLDEPEILRAVIETISENTNDAVIAPLFYLLLGGPAAMALYKAANTMDSMVGYRNQRYREFGWFAARTDDFLNLIPARFTAALVWTSALLLGFDARRSVRVTLRDGLSQPSPNAGYPEAAFAGALRVQLGGPSAYSGVRSYKAYLGDPVRPITTDTVRDARKLFYGTSFLMIGLAVILMRR